MLYSNGKLISMCEKPLLPTRKLPIVIAKHKKQSFGGHNPKRLTYVYTPEEAKALDMFNGFFIDRDVIHEFPVKVKDFKFRKYSLDFFDVLSRTNIEVSPQFHLTYDKVTKSDKRRKANLAKENIHMVAIYGLTEEKVRETIRIIEKRGINKGVLDRYA